jgi:CheY-like chemotaxis protein
MQQSLENAAMAAETIAQPRKAYHTRMLVVENSASARTDADAIAGWLNMEVDTAENGRIGSIMAMISLAEGRPYAIILCEMQSAGGGSEETVKWLRKNGWQGPIIGVGTDVSVEDRKRFVKQGCDDFIDKPLDNEKLLEAFGRLVQRGETTYAEATADELTDGSETTAIAPKDEKPIGRVLVVEDALCVQMIVGAFLQKMNFEVDTADNGRSACEMAVQSMTKGNPYDVILMDIQLPKMNGKKAAKWLRENGWTGPIIAASIHATDRNREEFLKAGCDTYISKPITEASLRTALSECLHHESPCATSSS